MGLFFNYDRPGPGVDKNAPRKKGMFLFLELLGRNSGKLLLANMLYFAVSLPILALDAVIVSTFLGNVIPEMVDSEGFMQIVVILTVIVAILWGTGPVTFGYTYILRNAAREEHTFLVSDFFEKSKENLLQGLVFLIVDIVMLVCLMVAIWFYWELSAKSGGVFTVLFYMMLAVLCIYTIMHFYMYELGVTFENSISKTYKNAFILTLSTLPMCILISLIVIFASMLLLSYLTLIGVVLVAFLCWISLMRFMVDFYAARCIKRMILEKQQ